MPWFADLLESNHQLESRMQENCLFGSEGGAKLSFVPTPIQFRPRWRSNSLQINRFYHQFLSRFLRLQSLEISRALWLTAQAAASLSSNARLRSTPHR